MGDFITTAGDGLEDLTEGLVWIESHKTVPPLRREDKIVYGFKFDWLNATGMQVVLFLHRCVEELIKNKSLFAQVDMLRSCHQSQSQTEKNFSNLIQQFHNIIGNIVDNDFTVADTQTRTESHVCAMWMSPLHVLTCLVVPAFSLKVNMFVETSAESSYVFQLFGEICGKIGPYFSVTEQSAVTLPVTFKMHHGSAHMFVYEDADVHSAVSVIVEYLWNMADQELCELTEVYVQESIHSKFSFLLKSKLAIKAENHKWVKHCSEDMESFTKYKDYIQCAVSLATSKGMDVWKHWEHSETFVPTVIFGKVERKQTDIPLPVICIDSFRTIEEGILLSEKSQKIRFASIWTESGPTAQYIAGQLKADLVWVNIYGLFSTKVPFHLTVSQRDCIGCIRGCCVSGQKWFSPIWQSHHVPLGFWKSMRETNDIKNVYKSAEESHMKWGIRSSSESRCEVLLKIVNSISCNKEQYSELLETHDCIEECVKLLYLFAYKCKEDSESRNVDNMLSITTFRPAGVVTIVCTSQTKTVDYLKLIFGMIAYGNSVVLFHGKNDKLAECAKAFCQHVDLPKGSVNFLECDHVISAKDCFHGKSYFLQYPYGSHILDHNVIEAIFESDVTKFNTTMFRWFTEPKSVFIPVK